MTATRTHTRTTTPRQPLPVKLAIGLLGFLGVTALGGGVELTFGILGTDQFPADWLDRIPLIDSWVLPGLVLGIGFGLGSLLVGYGLLRRPRWPWLAGFERLTGHHWSWAATVLIGLGHIGWILLEVAYLPALSPLELLYGGIGVALVLLPLLAPARTALATAPARMEV